MKTLKDHINEALKIDKKNLSGWSIYTCQPKVKSELEQIIKDRITEEGPDCDLNDIDTSLIDNMSYLFYKSDFTGDISEWDTSNAEDMSYMFFKSIFTGDISNWNTSNVKDMCNMFYYAEFNGDISRWDVSNVKYTYCMFEGSKFNQDISNWQINKNCDAHDMFIDCPIRDEFKPVF